MFMSLLEQVQKSGCDFKSKAKKKGECSLSNGTVSFRRQKRLAGLFSRWRFRDQRHADEGV